MYVSLVFVQWFAVVFYVVLKRMPPRRKVHICVDPKFPPPTKFNLTCHDFGLKVEPLEGWLGGFFSESLIQFAMHL